MKYNLILSLFLMIFLIGSVSALDFDNVKSYDEATKTVTITNAFGLGAKIAEVQLKTPLEVRVMAGEDRKIAEFEITSYEEYTNALKEMEFYNLKTNKKITKNFNYKYKVLDEVVDDPIYSQVCDGKTNINGTASCRQEITGYNQREIYSWKNLENAKLEKLPLGVMTIGIFIDVSPGERGEWIPTLFGERVPEWAIWTESLSVGLKAYYDFNNTRNLIDGTNNLTTNEGSPVYNATDCLIGLCGQTWEGNNFKIASNSVVSFGNSEYSFNLWARGIDNGASGNPYFLGSTTNGANQLGWDSPTQIYRSASWTGGSGNLPTSTVGYGNWFMITVTRNATATYIYLNGTLKDNAGVGTGTQDDIYLGNIFNNIFDWRGQFDETGYWNRTLTPSEITDLFNDGVGLTYSQTFPPIITINSPASFNYSSSPQNLNFNATATDGVEIQNASLWINGVLNYTQLGSSTPSLEVFTPLTLGEGSYNFYFEAMDDEGNIGTSEVRTILIDASPPIVTITSPANATNFITTTTPLNVEVNVSIIETGGFTNCWYSTDAGATNNSITCENNLTAGYNNGWTYFRYYANDTFGNIGEGQVAFFINEVNANLEYAASLIEGESSQVYLNITADDLSSVNATLSYNNTEETMSLISSNGTYAAFNKTIIAPNVAVQTNVPIWSNFTINGFTSGTANTTQIIYPVPDLIVQSTACSPAALKFDLKDEQNFTTLNGTFDYNFAYGTSNNNTFSKKFGQITTSTEFYVCINSTISNNWNMGSGEVFYRSPNYVERRYYLFEGTNLSSNTQNITLYDLLTTEQTSFKLEIEDTSLNPYVEKFTALLRWYPNLDEYLVVEMGQTDEKGDTVIHTQTEDVDYRIAVYEKNGSVIKIEDPTRMICLVNPCTYTMTISPTDQDFTSVFDVDYTFTYNQTTGMWSFIYSDSSQQTSEMNLTVYKVTGTSVYPVCSDVASGFTGVLSCNTSLYSGTLRGQVVRSASPGTPLVQKIITTGSTAFSSTFGLFLSLLIALPIIFIFAIVSPIAAILGGVLALIPALYFGAINWAIIGGIAVLGGIVAHFLKRVG